jgi:Flp pilus assembly protein TadD
MEARRIGVCGAILLLSWLLETHAAFPQSTPHVPTELPVISPLASNPEIDKLVRAGKWRELVSLSTELQRKDPDNPMLLYWIGASHLQLHEAIPAVQAFRLAERLGLNTAPMHEDLGLAYYDLNQFVLFEEEMRRAMAVEPGNSKPYYYLGLYRWTIRSDASGALDFFEKAIHLAPDDWKSVYQSGNCFEQTGKLEEARQRYHTAIELLNQTGAKFGWPYQGMARLLLDENPQAALSMAQKAVELQPDEPSHHAVLADVYERLGRLPDALHEAQIAAAQNPNDSKTHYALYKLYRQAGDARAKSELEIFQQTRALYDAD